MLFQPSCQVCWGSEIEQRLSQGLQLLQRQRLNAGDGGFAQGAAAAVELTQGYGSFSERTATGLALLPAFLSAFCNPLLRGAGVAQLLSWDGDDLHDGLASEMGKPFHKDSENGRAQIRTLLQDPLGAGTQLSQRPYRQCEQVEQGIEIGLLTKLLQAQPHHPIKECLQLLRQKGGAEPEAPIGQHA